MTAAAKAAIEGAACLAKLAVTMANDHNSRDGLTDCDHQLEECGMADMPFVMEDQMGRIKERSKDIKWHFLTCT